MALEVIILILLVVLIGLAIYILKNMKKPKEEEDMKGYGEIMKEIANLKTTVNERSQKEIEEQQRQKEYQEKIFNSFQQFERILSGTKRRGTAGEGILKEALSFPIKMGIITTGLNMDGKNVEFAWNLGDGKYIPIDAKLPEVNKLFKEYSETEDSERQKKLKREMKEKIKKHVQEVKKYINKSNTIGKAILAIPDGLMELFPEFMAEMKKSGVLVCGYSYVFFFGYQLAEAYKRSKETNDVEDYRRVIDKLDSLMEKIKDKASSIDRGIKMVSNANDEIKDSVAESERTKVSTKLDKNEIKVKKKGKSK